MLEECLKPGAELRREIDADPVAKEIVDLARPLEGLTRQDGIHAAAVVIGAEPLMNTVPLQQKGPDQEVVTQFDGTTIEKLGLLKMDFLGLRNLDVIDKAVELVPGLDISTIPLDDKKTYEMLARGEAIGVFQFEGSGMREALRAVKPTDLRGPDRARRALPAGADARTSRTTRAARTARSASPIPTSG